MHTWPLAVGVMHSHCSQGTCPAADKALLIRLLLLLLLLLLPPFAAPACVYLQPDVADSALTQAETFALHSRPASTRKIYLDFNGHVTTGTWWNSAYKKPTITTPAYDMVGAAPTGCVGRKFH